MKKRPARALLLALTLALLLSGCASPLALSLSHGEGEAAATEAAPETAPEAAPEAAPLSATHAAVAARPHVPAAEVHADLVINGVRMQLADEATKESWRAPLVKLLSNVAIPVYEDFEEVGSTAAVDPNAPTIPESHTCALFDVTLDGTPELLVSPYGYSGSSGNSTYLAFDIHTGERVGSVSSAHGDEFAHALRRSDGRICSFSYYYLRCGAAAGYWKLGVLGKSSYTDESGAEQSTYCTQAVTQMYYEYAAILTKEDGTPADPDSHPEDGDVGYQLVPDGEEYRVDGEVTNAAHHYRVLGEAMADLIRIPETKLQPVGWEPLPDDPTAADYVRRAEIMADALLASDQAFLRFSSEGRFE